MTATEERITALGLDFSTQSAKAVLVDVDARLHVVCEKQVSFLRDARLRAAFDLDAECLARGTAPGEANQPALLAVAALDALLADLAADPAAAPALRRTAVVAVSAQQHAHVLLTTHAPAALAAALDAAAAHNAADPRLAPRLAAADFFAVPFMRVWKTACTAPEAARVRTALGGAAACTALTGAAAPARFSAFGLARTAARDPAAYARTGAVLLLNTLVAALLTGTCAAPAVAVDAGAACGTALVDYRARAYAPAALAAVAAVGALPGGAEGLRARLPRVAAALRTCAGHVAPLFARAYGLPRTCAVALGSGDNPMTHVLCPDGCWLLSLGSSLVVMAGTRTPRTVPGADASYDGCDRPFVLCCRTNGAQRWDAVATVLHPHGEGEDDSKDDDDAHSAFEHAIAAANAETAPQATARMMLWHTQPETFPPSAWHQAQPVRSAYAPTRAHDTVALVDSSLASLYLHAVRALGDRPRTLYLAGGPAQCPALRTRIAALWGCPVALVHPRLSPKHPLSSIFVCIFLSHAHSATEGASLGAALAGVATYRVCCRGEDEHTVLREIAGAASSHVTVETPDPRLEAWFHEPQHGFLAQFEAFERKHLGL